MIIECTKCGQRGNLKTGSNMGWFEITVKAIDTEEMHEASLVIKCTECGNEVEY